ncbi:HAMP domain-containing protein [Paenibacillus hemerocallicola]|uniref:histidine kinase n=1 Tax=Paenibacillus hemerocallicola TaxID=1172614 RepID=A0A5C4T5M8_9BACL|nr:histidine kinase [Paenibacillus hemerocallicola]TNJ63627.1 HAMP domain-containing protein [Paenibacillus hemerocallicola]
MNIPSGRFGYAKPHSLKRSLFVGLLVSTIVPILLVGISSYYSIYTILDSKTASGINSSLQQVRSNMEMLYRNLNYVSQQMTNRDLNLLFKADTAIDKYILSQNVFAHLNLVAYTNPDIGLFYIANRETKDFLFQNYPVKASGDGEAMPVLTIDKGVTYQAPHRTRSGGQEPVFSISRPTDLLTESKYDIYVESDPEMYDQMLNHSQYGMDAIQVLTDEKGSIVFSQDESLFPLGAVMPGSLEEQRYQVIDNHYYFRAQSAKMGWYVYSIIDKKLYHNEVNRWTAYWLSISAICLLISAVIGWWIWRILVTPFKRLHGEIHQMRGDFDSVSQTSPFAQKTNVVEFDEVMERFQDMRTHIGQLMKELKLNEEEKRYLEVEKLVHQMNPHFLYNTLNTIQWLAKAKGQDEIVRLATVFIRLLRYNLGRDGDLVELRLEMNALNDYVTLQQIRYNYEFTVQIQTLSTVMDAKVPRFLLQPLIENALYHGLADVGGLIQLSVSLEKDGTILVMVKDNGKGMSEEEIRKLLQHDSSARDKVGMGIGLNYVDTMLRVHFGESARLQAYSSSNEGTTMYFRIPFRTGKGEAV